MPTDNQTTRLLEALQGLDLTSADGRAGIGTLLAEIERLSPGAVLRQAAGIDLRRLGWAGAGSLEIDRSRLESQLLVPDP